MFYEFIELEPFARMRDDLFSADEYLEFQWYLCGNPESGAVVPGTGGCRKIRWSGQGRGKRGGSRIIYFLRVQAGQIVLVAGYAKNEREDVPREWLRRIKEMYEDEQGERTD
jgi:hypothetical protein